MIKISKQKHLLVTGILALLLFSCVYASLMPSVHATEITLQQEGLSIMHDVVGLDVAKYSVTTKEIPTDSQVSQLGVAPKEEISFDLTSGESRLKTHYTFTDGKLQMIHVLETQGPQSLVKPASANAVEMAKDFLGNYQEYTDDPIYGQLKNTLDSADDCKNATKISGNTQLEVSAIDGYVTFRWMYTFNGVVAPSKVVALGFKNGFLKYFVDNWNLYGMGSTAINLVKNEAVAIALETAKTHNWSMQLDPDTLDSKNLNEKRISWTALIFDDSIDASKTRDQNPLMLYPVWRVGVTLDKWYGNMYGIEVDVWADTGEVRLVQEAWSTMDPAEEWTKVSEGSLNIAPSAFIALSTIATAIVGTATFLVSRKKKTALRHLLKGRGLKTGVLLCILAFSMMLAPIATVNATSRGAVVWGSESNGAYGWGENNATWRKSPEEINLQRNVASALDSYFTSGGYDSNGIDDINRQGSPGSEKIAILSDLSTLQSYHDYVAVVDFDHGVTGKPFDPWPFPNEAHYMFEDNTGTIIGPPTNETNEKFTEQWDHGVFDCEIAPLIQDDKVIFAFISACESANVAQLGQGWVTDGYPWPARALGMPFAWTGRLVMDKDNLEFNITDCISDDGYNDPDCAPQVYIGFPFGSAALEQKIPYPSGTKQYNSWVGDFFSHALLGDMSVNQALDQASLLTWPGLDFGASPLQTGFTAHWWNMANQSDCTMAVYGNGNIFLKNYEPDFVSKPAVSGPTSGETYTSYEFAASSIDPCGHSVQYTFDWGDGSSQTVTGWYSSGATAYVSHSWSLDDDVFSVTVKAQCNYGVWSSWSIPHDVIIGDPPELTVTVYAYDQYENPLEVPLYIDSEYVGTTGYGYTVWSGDHSIYVEPLIVDPPYAVEFDCYYYDGDYDYSNPTWVTVASDKTVTVYYYGNY